MFPRQDVLAASAMSAAMTASAGKAGSFGNPDQPAEGASGTSHLRKRKRASRGGSKPRARGSCANGYVIKPDGIRTRPQTSHSHPISITRHGVMNNVNLA